MAESSFAFKGTKAEIYQQLLPQLQLLIEGETNLIAVLGNTSAALKEAFGFFWVGFYSVQNDQLELGPFQGTVACTRIRKGKGVCGTAWETKTLQLVPDVEQFPGHIACSASSKSEIVVPILKNNEVVAVLDVDSDQLNDFDETDALYLSQLCQSLSVFF